MDNLASKVQAEVVDLHDFFVDWFSGQMPESDFEKRFLSRLDPGIIVISAAGQVLSRDALAPIIQQGYATNPDFRIAIRKVKVHRVTDNQVVATYEEWQRNSMEPGRSNNARVSTALFALSEQLRWLHVQETWLPDAVTSADPFAF